MHHVKSFLLSVAVAAFALASVPAQAMPVTVPAGLNPGDTYRLVFVTSMTRDAMSSDIADYNAFVTAAAAASPLAALGSTWSVIASTSSVDARDNTATVPGTDGPGTAIYRLDGMQIASSYADLWDGSLPPFIGINTDELGAVSNATVFTGTDTSGQATPAFELGSGLVTAGFASSSSGSWIQGQLHPQASLSFYAISNVLTVSVPEPVALAMFTLSLAGLAVAVRRRNAA